MKKLQPATLIAQLKSIIFIFLTLIIVNQLTAQTQATDHFRSRQSGNWGAVTTWESSSDSVNWNVATIYYPTAASSSITIRSGHIVTAGTTGQNADQMVIQSGGTLKVTQKFNINNGTGDDMTVYGTIESNSEITRNGPASMIMKAGSNYNFNASDANFIIYVCNWETGSNITINIGSYTSQLTNLGQAFYNFNWDGTGQSGEYLISFPPQFSVAGNLIFKTTNGQHLVLSGSPTPITFNVNGNFELQGKSSVTLTKATGAVTLNIGGNLNIGSISSLTSRLGIGLTGITNNVVNLAGNLNIITGSGINAYSAQLNGTIYFTNSLITQQINNSGILQRINLVIDQGTDVFAQNLNNNLNYFLSIEENGSLEVENFTNTDISKLLLKNNASLITNSTVVSGTMQRTLSNADWGVSQDGWHLLSSPVVAQNLSTGGFIEGNYDFYEWSEPRNLWLNQKVEVNNITSFVPGHGYFVAYQNGGTKSFAGVFNSASQVFHNLTITSNSPNSGYHLLGNPFPCALDWGSGSWNRLNVSNVANVWNETALNYLPVTISTDNIIPANQGFFVQAVAPENSITIPADARVHSNQAFYKKTEVSELLHLKMKCSENETWDETIIELDPDAFTSFDQMDGHEMQGSENAPQIYTILAEDEMLCVNALPLNDIPPVIPLYFRTGAGNNYTLEVLDNTISRPVYLEDLLTGTIQQLEKSLTLPLTASSSENRERFRLHMGPVRLPENESKPTLQVYSSGNSIYFKNSSADEMNVEFVVTDLSGKVIHCGKPGNSALSTVQLPNLITGVYLVTAISSDSTKVFKIYIQN